MRLDVVAHSSTDDMSCMIEWNYELSKSISTSNYRTASHCFCNDIKMIDDKDGYCTEELDDRPDPKFKWE